MALYRYYRLWRSILAGVCAAFVLMCGSGSALAAFSIGTLVLDGATEQATFGTEVESIQTGRGNACNVIDDPSPPAPEVDLIALSAEDTSGNPTDPGLRGRIDSFGVESSGNSCAYTALDETFIIEPGMFFDPGTFIEEIRLNVLVKQNAAAIATVHYLDGSTRQYRLLTGLSACGVPDAPDLTKLFECVSDSNPDSARRDNWLLTQIAGDPAPEWNKVEIMVTNGNLGVGIAELDLALTPTGVLGCEAGTNDFTIAELFFEIGIDDDTVLQCKRLPNADGSPCIPVEYLLDAACETVDGVKTCDATFLHADQDADGEPGGDLLDRENYKFLCEVWWPEIPADDFSGGQPVPETEQYWGVNDAQGENIRFCDGITPIISPDPAYWLSAESPTQQDGGTVTTMPTASLLTAYQDILVEDGVPDQCNGTDSAGNVCPSGRQIACLVDERNFQVPDPATPAMPDPATDDYVNYIKQFQRFLLQGDARTSKRF